MDRCSVEGCESEAKEAGMCWACIRALRRHGTTRRKRRPRHDTPKAMVMEAALALADAEEDGTWAKAWARLRMAIVRYRGRKNIVRNQPHSSG